MTLKVIVSSSGRPAMKVQTMSKGEIRKDITRVLRRIANTVDKIHQQIVIKNKILNSERYKNSKNISIYLSNELEVDTVSFLRQIIEIDKKNCYIPMINKPSCICKESLPQTRMKMVRLYSLSDYALLPNNNYGIKEPTDFKLPYKLYEKDSYETEREFSFVDALPKDHLRYVARPENNDLDLIIVPGVAFTMNGERLGHGKGYYDEFLNNWSESATKPLFSIGICFKEQIIDAPLAITRSDFVLDKVVTG